MSSSFQAENRFRGPIRESDLRIVGRLLKPHGICGEITALLTSDVDLDSLSCIMLRLDGIFVPFFLSGVRPKSSETDLLTVDGVENEAQASALCPADIYALSSELPEEDHADGFYASDLIGFDVVADGHLLGKITAVDDTTENYLFIIERTAGDTCLVPVADEFIDALDPEKKLLSLNLPEGLVEL